MNNVLLSFHSAAVAKDSYDKMWKKYEPILKKYQTTKTITK